jgi:hypothetical protein
MLSEDVRAVLCVAAGCLLAWWLKDEYEGMRKSADEWESGIRSEEFQKGYSSGYNLAERTAKWIADHPENHPVEEKAA